MSANSLGLLLERAGEAVHRRQQVVDGLVERGEVDGRGEDVVRGLAHVHVVVAVDALAGEVGDHLVRVHVRGGAGAGLEDVDRELLVVLAAADRVAASAIRSATSSSSRPSSALVRAAAALIRPSQWIDRERDRVARRPGSWRPPCRSRHPRACRQSFTPPLIVAVTRVSVGSLVASRGPRPRPTPPRIRRPDGRPTPLSIRSSPSPPSRSGSSSAGASATSSPRQLADREGSPVWSFYEGPPTANGRPGSHHVLARVFKDIYPRYKAMSGHYVPRKAGWDCHGLPVELEVEKELGISSKEEIEEFGIAEFNAPLPRVGLPLRRRLEPADRADRLLGRPRRPLRDPDNDYIESVWWSLRQHWDDDRLYQGHKVVPYCPRCGTALSSHEVALGLRGRRRSVRLRAAAGDRAGRAGSRPATTCSSGRRRRGR